VKFSQALVSGRLIKRYKRFLADVELDSGATITAVCPNTASMLGCNVPGSRVWLSSSDSLTRKYRPTWELVEVQPSVIVGINTSHPNREFLFRKSH
jgi:sugar fermentation stimulation protein A